MSQPVSECFKRYEQGGRLLTRHGGLPNLLKERLAGWREVFYVGTEELAAKGTLAVDEGSTNIPQMCSAVAITAGFVLGGRGKGASKSIARLLCTILVVVAT